MGDAMATKLSPEEKLVTAALAAIEKGGWKALSLTALARKAKIPPATLYELCPDKRALLALIAKRIDIAALERASNPTTISRPATAPSTPSLAASNR